MDPHSFIARAEAQRWLGIAEKLLMGHDLVGSKTFAIRARETDPRLEDADQILAITDILLAAEKRVVGNTGAQQPDFYAILQLVRFVQDTDHIADQYRRLAGILNPHQNRFPYSDQAFQLVNDAWAVLSNPMRKSMYDSELDFRQQQQQIHNLGFNIEQQHHQQHNFFSLNQELAEPPQTFQIRAQNSQQLQQHNFLSHNPIHVQPFQVTFAPQQHIQPPAPAPAPPPPASPPLSWPQALQQQIASLQRNAATSQVNTNNGGWEEEIQVEAQEAEVETENVDESPTFWTACPYCFYMYEYPRVYAECTLRCDNCKRAFQAVCISSPPPAIEGQEAYYYCWGFFPLGVSLSHMQKNNASDKNSNWTPFSPLNDVSRNVQDHLNDMAAPKKNSFVNRNLGPPIYIDDEIDDIFMGVSEPSDDSDLDWNSTKKKKVKKTKKGLKRPFTVVTAVGDARNGSDKNLQNGIPTVPVAETSEKDVGVDTRRQSGRVAKDLGKLDLNVEFNNNEGEESATRVTGGTRGNGQGEEDNIEEGIGFFEGLDEFFSSLPILSVVKDGKVKAG